MKPLIDFFKSNSVLVDILPKSETWSALLNEEVSSLTYEWLSQSLDKNKVKSWSTPLNSYCIVDSILDGCDRGQSPYYLPINTRE